MPGTCLNAVVHHSTSQQQASKRLLVLSVSAGSGHVRAAEAICAKARDYFPGFSVRHRDLMQLMPKPFRKMYTDFYLKLASGLPEAWGWLYRKTDCESSGGLIGRLRRSLQRLCAHKLFDEIQAYAPDVIICTHFLPAELLGDASLQKRLHCPLWVVVTDFDLHQMWIHPGVTGYFVANEEIAYRLHDAGIPESQIVVTGIPVMPAFAAPPERSSSCAKWGLDPSRPTVLMMGGGAGLGMNKELVTSILEIDPALQMIVIAGKNKALLDELTAMSCLPNSRLIALGYTDKVPELMACADLVITKPGGLSTSECLVMGLPMLLINPIPGQEERNASHLLQEGVAQRADDATTLIYRLRRLLNDRASLRTMTEKTIPLARPHAASLLLHHAVSQLSPIL